MPYPRTEPTDSVEREALLLSARASEAWHQKQFTVARELVNKGLSISQQAHYTLGIIGAQHLLANIAFDEGDLCTARALHEEVLVECRRLGWPGAIASTLNGLGVVAEREGCYAEACTYLEESIRILEELGSTDTAGQVRRNLDRVSAWRRNAQQVGIQQGGVAMPHNVYIDALDITVAILCPPFEWCPVQGGPVVLEDASQDGGTAGGCYEVANFGMARYPITNAQYERFLVHPNGFANPHWWTYSLQAARWRQDHPKPKATAFPGPDLTRTRVSWFDSMAFCHWLSAELTGKTGGRAPVPHDIATWCVCLPTEQEWQRAALGDTGWRYPWGDELDERRANRGKHVGQPAGVGQYPAGQSPFQVLDMIGNIWEWCLNGWGGESIDVTGYMYRAFRGGAWNVSNPDYLAASGRGAWPPRGQLNDCGFRCRYQPVDQRGSNSRS